MDILRWKHPTWGTYTWNTVRATSTGSSDNRVLHRIRDGLIEDHPDRSDSFVAQGAHALRP
jgi:hypothetical protein